jgi:hypothetical protein
MYKLALMFASLFFLAAVPAEAAGPASDKWLVTQLSGDARVVHPGLQPMSLRVNGELAPGDTLLTGRSGRATLVRGADYIIVAPGSELKLPAEPQPTGFTRVVQKLGTLLFKVKHTGIPHFAVDTPMLAAVVKGTTFTVIVDQQRSAVQVIQGAVQVSAIDGGMSRIVEGGRTVFVDYAHPKMLLDADKPVPPATRPSSTSVRVSAAGESPIGAISTLTGGLVRADLANLQPAAPVQLASTQIAQAQPSVAVTGPTPGTSPSATVPPGTQSVATPPATAPASAPIVAAVTTPVAAAPAVTTIVAPVTTPAVAVVTAPSVTVPSVTVPAVSTPTVTVPSVTVPAVTTPTVTVPAVTTPTVTVPSVTTPVVPISTPTVTVPAVTTPTVTVPTVTTPVVPISTPTVTLPSISTPTLTIPSITTPVVPITTPTIVIPSISTPTISIPPLLKF